MTVDRRCVDWRDVPGETMVPVYEAECHRWADALGWDLSASCRVMETARQAGHLPGFVVTRAGGDPIGWTYFLLHGDVLQLGALSAPSAVATRALLEAVLASPEATLASTIAGFVFPASTALQPALARARFTVLPFLYLERPIVGLDSGSAAPEEGPPLRALGMTDVPALARLLADVYSGREDAVCYAPHGRLVEWATYLTSLVRGPGCGRFLPGASFTSHGQADPAGMVITTEIGRGVAHVAQIAVASASHGRGVGTRLLRAAIAAAARHGATRLTLLVARNNLVARRLYEREGFTERASFLFARRPRPTRQIVANRRPELVTVQG